MIRDTDFTGKLIFECEETLPLDRGYWREILYKGGIEVTAPAIKIIDNYSQPYLIPERTELIPFTEEEKQFLHSRICPLFQHLRPGRLYCSLCI